MAIKKISAIGLYGDRMMSEKVGLPRCHSRGNLTLMEREIACEYIFMYNLLFKYVLLFAQLSSTLRREWQKICVPSRWTGVADRV